MRSNHIFVDQKVRQKVQKKNLKIKVSILLLFITLIMVSVIIIFGNYCYIMSQSNIHVDKEIVTEHNSHEKADIEIQTQEKIKRILIDTQINIWTKNDQINPKVSTLSDGNFVVVWQSNLQHGTGYSIYGQIFNSNGAKKGTEFQISDSIVLNPTNPNVAGASSGKFIVIWQQSDRNIFGKIFTNDGTKLNSQFQINTDSVSYNPETITALKNNNFVVTWDLHFNLYFQILTDNGIKVGSQLNITSAYFSSITSLANGNFVIVYRFSVSICAEIFYSDGTLLKSQFNFSTNILN